MVSAFHLGVKVAAFPHSLSGRQAHLPQLASLRSFRLVDYVGLASNPWPVVFIQYFKPAACHRPHVPLLLRELKPTGTELSAFPRRPVGITSLQVKVSRRRISKADYTPRCAS